MNEIYEKPEVVVEDSSIGENSPAVIPSAKELRMQEDDLLKGLLEAATFKEDEKNYKTLQIKRGEGKNKKLLFEFTIRPLSEEEIMGCRKASCRHYPHPSGKKYGTIEGELDLAAMRSRKILLATIPGENGQKIWENPTLMSQLNCLTAVDVIDQVLLAGEKAAINEVIDRVSGYDADEEEFLKN